MSDRKRRLSFLTPIKNKLTQKRRNTNRKTPSPIHVAEGYKPEFVDRSISVTTESSVSTISDSDVNDLNDSVFEFTTTLNQSIKNNSLAISPLPIYQPAQANKVMDLKNFALLFSQALAEENVCQGLRNAMKPLIDPLEKKLDDSISRIIHLEKSSVDTTTKFEAIDQRMDDLEQYSRKNNVRIIGLAERKPTENKAAENTPSLVVNFINDTMNLNINSYDIGNAHRLGSIRREGPEHRDIIVQFSTNIIKQQVMRNRRQLKDINRNIYINDDLTKNRALLFKDARNELRNKRLSAVWTRDGNIFAKLTENSRPLKIDNNEQLSNLIRQ